MTATQSSQINAEFIYQAAPSNQQTASPAIRDQLMADIPGIDEPMDRVLLDQTHSSPQWSRVEWAQQLLLHAYTHSSTRHSAPLLTAVAFINWWEGRDSKAHQFLELALEADPAYHLARLSYQMIGSGMVAGWNMDKEMALKWTAPHNF